MSAQHIQSAHPSPLPPPPSSVPTYAYGAVIDFHFDKIAVGKNGRPRPKQVLKNQRYHIDQWLGRFGLTSESLISQELGPCFSSHLEEFADSLREAGYARQTVNAHVSTLKGLRESFAELLAGDGLPASFHGALRYLIRSSGFARFKVAKATGIDTKILKRLVDGHSPRPSTFLLIGNLEEFFNLPPGALTGRLGGVSWQRPRPTKLSTGFRDFLSEARRLPYRLVDLPHHVEGEWEDLARFHTDPIWVQEQGLKQEPRCAWRVRRNRGYSPTERLHKQAMTRFFGFLGLPSDAADERLRGLGMNADVFTLALLSDASVVRSFILFSKARSYNKDYNAQTRVFLCLCTKLLYAGRGYLYQHPEFGAKLPVPVPPERWHDWCKKNRELLVELWNIATPRLSPNEEPRRSHDPFEVIGRYIDEREHPITVLWELAHNMESLLPTIEKLAPVTIANFRRNLLMVKFFAANPLRCENLSMMTYIPRDWEEAHADVDRVQTESSSNLYQRPDGSWWVRFENDDFKVNRGKYDVPLADSVWPALREYLFRHRPVLNRAIREAITERRRRDGLHPLTAAEEMAIERCPYVFRYLGGSVNNMRRERFERYTGAEQAANRCLRDAMIRLTRTYLPDCPGFGPHACRYFVATEIMKNDVRGKEAAAAALHICVETAALYYARVRSGDKMKKWNRTHESLRKRWDAGEI